MDEVQVHARMKEIAESPLEERADLLDGLIDELESILEETSHSDADPQA